MFPRPTAVAFDVIGTLFSLEPLRERLTGVGLRSNTLELWYARTLRDGFALAASGMFRPFLDVARGTLAGLLAVHDRAAGDSEVETVANCFSALPAYPDVGPAMKALRENEVRVLALTNGSMKNTQTLLKEAGLDAQVEQVVSIDEIKAWKPLPAGYQYAARVAGCDVGRSALVAAHAWDCQGAARAGLVTGWVRRTERCFNPALGRPDVEGDSLEAVCGGLLGRSIE